MYTPIYAPYDLGAFSEDLRGQTIDLLQNPTRGFRKSFFGAIKDEFIADVAYICNIRVEDIDQAFAQYEEALFMWLFVPVMGNDEKVILPQVYRIWDVYAEERVKKLSAPQTRSEPGATAGPDSTPVVTPSNS
jgi:hypothetical protein